MSESTEERIALPNFQEVMRRRYTSQPSDATYWRWCNGIVPPQIRFLVERPDLAEALAADARALANQREPAAVA